MISIIYLYTSVNGFVLSVLKALYESGQVKEIHLVYREKNKTDGNRFIIEGYPWLKLIARHSISQNGIFKLLRSVQPQIVYLGWNDKSYIRAVKRYRTRGGKVQVVCGIDDQWKGSLRQLFGRIFFRFFYRSIIDYMWVSGKPQYHYAQQFGYKQEKIIHNLLSADTAIFDRKANLARRFVYVGRFVPIKGIDLLLTAYESLPDYIREEWPLILIGDGSLREQVLAKASAQIIVKSFLQPHELRDELMLGGVACVPSYKEQWGVVIHEMALLGYPMVVSSGCGAATEFLVSGYNGYLFPSNNLHALRDAMLKIVSLTDAEYASFADRSREFGLRITPEHAAYSLLSVLSLADMTYNSIAKY